MLGRTTGETRLEFRTWRSHHFYWRQWSTTGFNIFNLYLSKVFRSIYDPYKPLKARQIFDSKRKQKGAAHTRLYGTFIYKAESFTFRSVFSSLVSPRVGAGVKLGSFKNKAEQSCLHLKIKQWSYTVEPRHLKFDYLELPTTWNSNYFPLNTLFHPLLLPVSNFGYLKLFSIHLQVQDGRIQL